MNFSKPFDTKLISRRDLPGYERKGCLAQEMVGDRLLFVTFHSSRTDVQLISGLPCPGIIDVVFNCVSGLKDTVVLGSHNGSSESTRVVLLDVLMVEQGGQRKEAWSHRLATLAKLWERLSPEAKEMFPLARKWTTGLLMAFDKVQDDGGFGLLLRQPGKPQAVQCTER